jgi:hypothetical protein
MILHTIYDDGFTIALIDQVANHTKDFTSPGFG